MKSDSSQSSISHPSDGLPGDPARSAVKRMMSKLRRGRDVRRAKVAEVRRSIEGGAYAVEDKLDIAVDRLLDELDGAIALVRATRAAPRPLDPGAGGHGSHGSEAGPMDGEEGADEPQPPRRPGGRPTMRLYALGANTRRAA